VVFTSFSQSSTLSRTGTGFRACQKGRPHLHSAGAQCKCGDNAASIPDAAGRENWNFNRIDNLWYQRHSADERRFKWYGEGAAMRTCLAASRDDRICPPFARLFVPLLLWSPCQ
jgi:hypothetical protein